LREEWDPGRVRKTTQRNKDRSVSKNAARGCTNQSENRLKKDTEKCYAALHWEKVDGTNRKRRVGGANRREAGKGRYICRKRKGKEQIRKIYSGGPARRKPLFPNSSQGKRTNANAGKLIKLPESWPKRGV